MPDVEQHPNAERVKGRVLVVAIDDVRVLVEGKVPLQGGQTIANEQPVHTSLLLQQLGTFLHEHRTQGKVGNPRNRNAQLTQVAACRCL